MCKIPNTNITFQELTKKQKIILTALLTNLDFNETLLTLRARQVELQGRYLNI